jgi:hypothetical protein
MNVYNHGGEEVNDDNGGEDVGCGSRSPCGPNFMMSNTGPRAMMPSSSSLASSTGTTGGPKAQLPSRFAHASTYGGAGGVLGGGSDLEDDDHIISKNVSRPPASSEVEPTSRPPVSSEVEPTSCLPASSEVELASCLPMSTSVSEAELEL